MKRCDRAIWVWPDPQDAPTGWMHRSLLTTCPVNTSSVMIRRSHLDRAGLFDESLRCWEDYDMWLRLALQGPFRFLPGPAVLYQVAASGRFLSSVLTGESEHDLRQVVHAGLERLRSKEEVSEEFRPTSRRASSRGYPGSCWRCRKPTCCAPTCSGPFSRRRG